jgi:hypothetical protein
MLKVFSVLLAVALGLSVGACSKCDVPDLFPKSCNAGPGTGAF